jgi:hypothetical protein
MAGDIMIEATVEKDEDSAACGIRVASGDVLR